ncbi:MAG TPA: hypothetical protein VD862_02055 [Candidatus Paceibacterota bacterium]|nr:hypothetical protein [Candidatus Paceibacterota bacterium]
MREVTGDRRPAPEDYDEAWRRIVGLILDGLDLGEREEAVRPLLRDLHLHWGSVIGFTKAPDSVPFQFWGQEGQQEFLGYFSDARALLVRVRQAVAGIPGRSAVKTAQLHHELDTVQEFLDLTLARFSMFASASRRAVHQYPGATISLSCNASIFKKVAVTYEIFLQMLIGEERRETFKEQFNEAMRALNEHVHAWRGQAAGAGSE